jgi:hypothetical protein
MSPKSRPLPAPTCSIESLPNEILERVFSLIPLDEPVEYHTTNGDRRLLSQVVALMHTSPTFRFVTMSSKFWLHYDFDFAALVPDRNHNPRGNYYLNPETRLNRLCYLLFSIPELARNLQRKTDWSINRAPEVILLALASLPFLEIARRVSLVDDSASNLLLHRLSYCRCLIDLEISSENKDLDLDVLECFYALKRIVLELPKTWHGHCDGIVGLEQFTVAPNEGARGEIELSDDLRVLPVNSNDTLVSLEVRGFFSDAFSLDDFEKLESLVYKTDPLTHSENVFLDVLAQNASTLRSFDTEFIIVMTPNVEELTAQQTILFSCPCFRALKELSLKILYWGLKDDASPYIERCMDVVEVISESLATLQLVKLFAGLDVAWTGCLSKLRTLTSLTWNFPRGGLGRVKPGGANAAEIVAEVFKDFVEPPEVCVQLVRWNVSETTVHKPSLELAEFPECGSVAESGGTEMIQKSRRVSSNGPRENEL